MTSQEIGWLLCGFVSGWTLCLILFAALMWRRLVK